MSSQTTEIEALAIGTKEEHRFEVGNISYDHNGNMTWDGNKGITVTYNHLNLPERVDFGDGKYIEYTYDATGTKLRQEVHDGQNPVKRTDYVGGMVYEDGQLQFIQHGEGRIVMVDNEGLSKLPEYQYHLKDHLGNVRLTFSATPETESNTATLETAHEEEESSTFLRYAETTKVNSTLFDHTDNGDTHYAIRLNGTANERRGLARSLAVMTGDTIRAEAHAKYLDPDQNNWTTALQNLMAAIAAGTAPVGTVIEAVPPSGSDDFPFAGLLDAAKADDTGLKAYLNILLFDEGLKFLDAAYVPVTDAAKENGSNTAHEKLAEEIIVQQPGYVYIYFSNDNDQPLEVFFDDFTVEHVHSAIVQADDYYPFGLTFNGYRRENSVANKYLYNGKELQEDLGLGTFDFHARMYDPAIARTFQIDPHAENYYDLAPYSWVANNPILFTDPTGMDIDLGNLYEKDDEGNYLHQRQILAFELFASTKTGKEFITQRAQKGFKLEGAFVKGLSIETESAGDLSSKIDANFKVTDLDTHETTKDIHSGALGLTESEITDKGKLSVTYHMHSERGDFFKQNGLNTELGGKELLKSIDTWSHEIMIHGQGKEQDFLNGKFQGMTGKLPSDAGRDHSIKYVRQSHYYKNTENMLRAVNKRLKLGVSDDYIYRKIIFHGYD